MLRLFSQTNQGNNGLSPMRPARRGVAGGGGRKTRGPSVFFGRRRLASELGFATCRWAACGKAKLSRKFVIVIRKGKLT